LRQWPVQLKLLNAAASYFDDADLLISGDCVPFAYADFHRDFLRDKIAIIFCPKLDTDVEGYVTKLAEIFSQHTIRSITVLHMEVPCCSGVRYGRGSGPETLGKGDPGKRTDHTDNRAGCSGGREDGPAADPSGPSGIAPRLTVARHIDSPSGNTGGGDPPPS